MSTIFLSWSGKSGQLIAELLRGLLPAILPSSEPFMSHIDINKGKPWKESLNSKLATTSYGMFILTPDTRNSEWMAYEAGAISKGENIRLYSILFDVPEGLIPKYLSDYQASAFKEEDWKKLLREISDVIKLESQNNPKDSKPDNFDMLFRLFWREFRENTEEILKNIRDASQNDASGNTNQQGDPGVFASSQEIAGALQSIQEIGSFAVKIPDIEKKLTDFYNQFDSFQSRLVDPLREFKILTNKSPNLAAGQGWSGDIESQLSRLKSIILSIEKEGLLDKGNVKELTSAFEDLERFFRR